MNPSDTIFALATGLGRAAIAILRISGPETGPIMAKLAGRLPAPREARLRRLRGADGEILDHAMLVWLPAPANFTGEDSAELHLHAGLAVIEGVSVALVTLGARPAEPGEFSRRAFLNGRLELTEAEAVADLIDAETAAQRRQALRQLDGELGRLFDNWARRLKFLLAEQEALIDFPEDAGEDLPDNAPVLSLIEELEAQLADDRRGERLREGLSFVVTGPPNAGKSSLINALSRRDTSIVAPTAGTTRDVIEVRVIFGGVPVVLLDTAGLRDSTDPIEAEGVRRALAAASRADLVLLVEEAGRPRTLVAEAHIVSVPVATKIDIVPEPGDALGVSVVSGAGLAELRERLDEHARRLTYRAGPPPLTRARHRAACADALRYLGEAMQTPVSELRAEALRLAMRALGRVTGRVGVEQVLDVVFSQFCIGK